MSSSGSIFLVVVAFIAASWLLDIGHAASNVCPLLPPAGVSPSDEAFNTIPFVDGNKLFIGGKIKEWEGKSKNSTSPIVNTLTGERIVIGRLAQLTVADSLSALSSAKAAWQSGQGVWPQMTPAQRIDAMETFVEKILLKRSDIVRVLSWEICKNNADAAAEFDRTVAFIKSTIQAYRDTLAASAAWKVVSGISVKVTRVAIGVMLCLSPFNYPLNEAYAVLIPALLCGNVAVMKVPTTGGLAHMYTMEAFMESMPPGVINFVSGGGRDTMPPIMKTGDVDILAFIGGTATADKLIKEHPNPHRLKLFLQLEGKNLGIVMPDADLDVAAEQVMIGSTSYNGQRCTAIKLTMVHESVADVFLAKLVARIADLKAGLPWEDGVSITPLPEENKTDNMQDLVMDAVSKGARLVNDQECGGSIAGALMKPAIVYPVTQFMRLWHEEQFGPVVPVATFKEVDELFRYYAATHYGQQAAVFTTFGDKHRQDTAALLDVLSTSVGRININTQCGRSPDTVPFSGRRGSALGTMSVPEALRSFTVEVVVAGKSNQVNDKVLRQLDKHARFLSLV